MGFRSPTPDGLTTAPNAAGDVNNPAATQQELQSHRYWGRYATEADLPNNGANAAAAPAYEKMAPGDVAYNQADGCLYVLQDRGTLGGNDAVWACMVNAGVDQTIRDAHVFVVAIDGALSAIGSQAIPPNPANNANLTAAGDVVGVTCDYLDPGDGTQLEQAILAASTGGTEIDIRIRPGTIFIDPSAVTALPMVLPNGCQLIGAGIRNTTIIGGNGTGGTTQEVFSLLVRAGLHDMTISSPLPVAPPAAGASPGVVACTVGSNRVENCRFEINTTSSFDRTQVACLLDIGGGNLLVESCEFVGANGAIQPTPAAIFGVRYGTGATVLQSTISGAVRNTRFLGFNQALVWQDCAAGAVCENCTFQAVDIPQGVVEFTTTQPFAGGYPGPRLVNLTIDTSDFGSPVAPSRLAGIFIDVSDGVTLHGFLIDNIQVKFRQQVSDARAKTAVYIRSRDDNSQILGGTIRGIVCQSTDGAELTEGVYIRGDSNVAPGGVFDVRIADVVARNCQTLNAIPGRGVYLLPAGTGTVERCSVMNCSLGEADTAGVEIAAAAVDTQVGFCHLTTATGTPLIDGGTNTEAAHNII